MKNILIAIILFCACSVSRAYDPVKVRFIDGIYNYALKEKMERRASELLTIVNIAKEQNQKPDFHSLLRGTVADDMSDLWDFTPFECLSINLEAHCISTRNGYQLRHIQLLMDSEDKNEPNAQEASISFGKNGDIIGFHITINSQQYDNIIKANKSLDDLQRRQQILDYVEQFRTAYETKDTTFMRQVFSEDALIITGKVVRSKPMDGMRIANDKITYTRQTKNQYLTNLKRVFMTNKRIRVTFDEVEIMAHPTNSKLYGVTLKQGYTSDTYHDDGYLFMYWNFMDEDHPEIMVRTWQPNMLNGRKLSRNEIFGLGDF